ncbi:MAG: 50S ribosomal protein L9 [Dehalococcoidia bacterium]|nr:50S ribosomal protein L9 [Dehalococcoidia bacterium]
MRVVFQEDIPNVARAGEVKNVTDGFARNYLLPKKLAVLATPSEMQRVESVKKVAAKKRAQVEADLAKLAETLSGASLTFKAKAGEQNRLYGSITGADIAAEIQKVTGVQVDKRKIVLEEPLRQLGEFEVGVRLSKDLEPKVKVVIVEEGPSDQPGSEQRETASA